MSIAARALHGVNVCIIPMPANDDRPLLLRPWSLKIMAALLVAAKLSAATLVALSPTYAELSTITADRIVQLTNAERVKVGLTALTVNTQLTAAAKDKAAHMLAEDYFAHISPAGVTPWFWMSKHGYAYQVAGENLAIDFVEAEKVVAAWLASPSHKDNMLHPAYTETGVAAVAGEFQGATSTVVVHMFGLPTGTDVAAESTPTPDQPTHEETTPLPTPTAVPPPPELPRTPRIALLSSTSTVGNEVELAIEGEANSEVVLAVNSTPVITMSLSEDGQGRAKLDLSEYSDGQLQVTAVARVAGQQSEAAALIVAKDSTGPEVGRDAVSFLVSPLFDSGRVYVKLPEDKAVTSWQINGETVGESGGIVPLGNGLEIAAVDAQGNTTVVSDIVLVPQFEIRAEDINLPVLRRAVQVSNRFIGTMLAIITGLLIMTIIVRVQIQRPRLLGQATAVVFLAGVLLWL